MLFRVDRKIGTKYSNSPFYKGTILWNELSGDVQKSETMFVFKQSMNKLDNTFDRNDIVQEIAC